MTGAPTQAASLLRAAAALQQCRELLAQIEAASLEPAAPGQTAALQAIDLLGQQLADLATWLAGLARDEPQHSLQARLRLDGLRRQLLGQPPPDGAPPLAPELF